MALIGAGVGLQLLGLAIWIGGLMFLLGAVLPVARRQDCGAAAGAMARRFHKWELLAIVSVLVGAGVLYVGDAARMPLYADAAISALMFLVFAVYAGGLSPGMPGRDPAPKPGYAAMLTLNLVLGVALVVALAVLVARTSLVVVNETQGGFSAF